MSAVSLLAVICAPSFCAVSSSAQSNLIVSVRHAPALNGSGRIEGSVQQLLGENVTFNGGFVLTGDFLVPGTPMLQINGNPTFAGTIVGANSISPSGYRITLNGNVFLGYVRNRINPIALPTVPPPPPPAGTRSVTISSAGQAYGDPATLRNLTLNGNVDQLAVPPGTYGNFIANGGSGFRFGVPGATTPAVYNLQNLTLNGNTRLEVVGPVILTVANGVTGNGLIGTTNQSSWLQLQLAAGGLSLNGGCTMHGSIVAPAGTVIVNGNSCLVGSVKSDRLTLNGNGCIKAGSLTVNQPPAANAQSVTTTEDAFVNLTLTGSDPEDSLLAYSILTHPTRGTLSGTAPNLVYTPAPNENGTDSFTFKVNDGTQDSAAATVSITITPVNDAPTAQTQSISAVEEGTASIYLLGSDAEGSLLTYSIVSPPEHGTLINPAPELVYLPDPNFNGPDSFTFRVNDGQLDSMLALVTISVNPLNDRPVAETQSLSTDEDTTLPVILTGFDIENEPLAYTLLTQPSHGILSGTPPNLSYLPSTNYSGSDSFTFLVDDGTANSVPANISLTIKPVNDRPVAYPSSYTTLEDIATNVVITASDIEDANLTYVLVTLPAHGLVTGAGTNLVYSPAADYHGTDSFTFKASDGALDSDPVTISLTIVTVNDTPVATAKTITAEEDTPASITLTGTDVDGETLAFSIVSQPGHGTLTGTAPFLTYTPADNFNGTDTFTYTASDGSTNSEPAIVTITINPVNDAPVADEQSLVAEEDTPLAVILTGADDEGDTLSFTVVSQPLFGSLSGTAPNFTYAPDSNFYGIDSFDYIANDGQLDSALATVTVEVLPVNDAPSADFMLFEPAQGTGVKITLTGSDADDDALTFLIVSLPAHGTLAGDAPHLTYTPMSGYFGSDSFTFLANDGQASSPPVTATIHVAQAESGNFAAEAGPDQVVTFGSAVLAGTVIIPTPVAGSLTNALWSKESGPGTVQFTSPAAFVTDAVFAEPGEYTLKLLASYNGGQRSDTLTVAVLPPAPDRLAAARSSRGSDFWLTFLDNAHAFGESDHSGLSFSVTAESDTTGVVSFYGQGEWHTNYFAVHASIPTIVPIADYWSDPTLAYSDTIQTNAIHINTAGEVTVHGLNFLDFTTDGYLALPTALLGTEYIILGYMNSPSASNPGETFGGTQFAIVGTDDETLITITPTLTTGSRAADVPYQITLQRGQTYRLMNTDSLTGDLSGTIISADKPISVFGGHQCANVPAGVFACDHLVEQLPPVNLWGQQFVTMPLATRSGGDTFRILAMADDTLVAVNGEVVARLNRGQLHERTNNGPAQILSSQPVLVAQYANGSTYDGSTGDPFMMLVPPAEQFGGSYTLATPQVFDYWAFQHTDIFANYLNLTVRTNGVNAIQLDGASVAASLFQPIGNSGYAGAQVAVPPGTHRLTASVPFGVSLYGWAQFESYAYIGGIYSESVEADTQLVLRHSSDRALVGTEKVVIASVTNGRQRPLAGVELTFDVTGANSVTRRVRTNPSGDAVFTYTGTNAGEDVIQAVVVGLNRAVTNIWLQTSDNLPPIVDPGMNQLVALNEITHLEATVTDDGKPTGGTLTFQWRTTSGYAPARFTQPNQPVTDVSFDLPGIYQLELTVSDSMFSVCSNVTITVNDTPRVRSLWSYPFDQPYSVGQTVALLAQVSDSDGSVTSVEFFDGELNIGDAGPPDSMGIAYISWTIPQSGILSITVQVTDDLGGVARSAPLVLQSVSPPIVEWINPANNYEAIAGVPLQLTINAADLDGSVTNVLFVVDSYTPNYDRAEFAATASGPNYTGSWIPPRTGDYYFYAYAWDNDGAAGAAGIYVQVTAPVPVVTLQTFLPDEVGGALAGFPLLLSAEASVIEPVRIERVEFYESGGFIGSITNGPYLMPFAPTNPGPHSFTARAFTEVGSSADSAAVSVTAVPFLEVIWEDPKQTEWVPLGSARQLSIRLQDPGSIFSNVTFLVNSQPLATTELTFVDWTPITAGDYILQARVRDLFGNDYVSEELTLHAAELHAPQVQILEPANGARFAAGEPVNFSVATTDSDNVVTNVSLHLYSVAEMSAPGGSLAYSWQGLPPGAHEFTAIATDNTGQKGETRVRIFVGPSLNTGLQTPQDLSADAIGCNAVRISWNHPSTDTNELVVVERAIGVSDVWEPVGYLPVEESFMEDHALTAGTLYRYRAHVRSSSGERSPYSNVATVTTRPYLSNYAVLDLAESLVDDGVATPVSAMLKRRSRAELRTIRNELRRVDNSSPLDLGLTAPFGISDNNEVLLLDPFNTANPTTFLWRPAAQALEFDRGTFEPYRLADFGAIVGANLQQVEDSQGQSIQQWHAGVWAGTFLDFTPDVAALRIPIAHPPHPEPYPTLNALLDLSRAGFGVGLATWLYFPDANPNSPPLTTVKHATLWPTNGQPPVSFGALQQLNNESGFWAINEAGDIIGQSRLFDASRPAITITHAVRSHVLLAGGESNDKLVDLGTLGGDFSAAIAINQGGTAVGYSTVQPDDPINETRAVYWLRDDLSPRQLPGFSSTNLMYAWDIDDRATIIGQAVRVSGETVAAMWLPNSGAPSGYGVVDLNDYASNRKWSLTSARYINTNGFIVGSGLHARSSFINGERVESLPTPRTCLLVPNVSLAVDYNRDGKIELSDKDNLPAGQPFQFWVNDDTDDGEVGRDKILHAVPVPYEDPEFDPRYPNYYDSRINGAQDLTDWFPVLLNISNLLALLPPEANEYRLVHSERALKFLYTDLPPDASGSYLTNSLMSGFGIEFNQPVANASGVQEINEHGVILTREFLSRIRQQGKGVLLLEASKPTTEPLRLEVRNSRRVVATVELPLRIGNVEDMYGWNNLRFVVGEGPEHPTNLHPSNWPKFADAAASFVFLHGYNVNEMQSRDWSVEMFKRLWWSGSRRRFYGVSWRGNETQLAEAFTINYHLNVSHAFTTASHLALFLKNGALGDVSIAGHSLGNVVVSAAIQDHGARPTRYFMVDAAVAMEAYEAGLTNEPAMTHREWRAYTNRLYASEWYDLFPSSDGRHNLTWRGRFSDVPKFTQLYNFYSSGEEVLENHRLDNNPLILDVVSLDPEFRGLRLPFTVLPGSYAWALQEQLKGRITARDFYALYAFGGPALDFFLARSGVHAGNVLGSKYGGWGFNPDWDLSGSTRVVNAGGVTVQIYEPGGQRTPASAESITKAELQTNSFFLRFLNGEMYQAAGSTLASDVRIRAQLLAEAIPARTFAVGANAFPNRRPLDQQSQFDMNSVFQQYGWPAERLRSEREKSRWKHSDVRDIPFQYTVKVFHKWVELGGGR